jgi:hypothetical protein
MENKAAPLAGQAAPYDWRAVLPIHPYAAAFPELSREELIALGNDIAANGLRLPIVVHTDGDHDNPKFQLVDGRSRLDAMTAVGIEFEIVSGDCPQHGPGVSLNIPDHISGVRGGTVQMASLRVGMSSRRCWANVWTTECLIDACSKYRRALVRGGFHAAKQTES